MMAFFLFISLIFSEISLFLFLIHWDFLLFDENPANIHV